MLRILAIVLLVGNALLLAAQFGLFDRLTGAASVQAPQREPERLQRQIDPQAVRILSPQAASAALAAMTAAQATTAASNARPQACLEAGPFSAGEAGVAARTLRDAGLSAASWQALTTKDSGAFMVYMGRYADRETLQAFERDGFAPLRARFAARDVLLGKPVTTTLPDLPAGTADGVDATGT